MGRTYSLYEIVNDVIDEKIAEKRDNAVGENSYDTWDNDAKRLQRNFYSLIENLGTTKETLKGDAKTFQFHEKERFVIKYILSQIYDQKGLIYDFAMSKNKGEKFKSRKVHKMVQELCDAAEKDGMKESELIELVEFFSNIFLESPLRSIEYCHALVDSLAFNLQELPYNQKATYLLKFEDVLKKTYAMRVVELALNTANLGEYIEKRRELVGDDIYNEEFFEYDPPLRYYFMERDKELLGKIQEDEDLRYYIEKKLGKKAEEIFNYAKLNK